MAIRIFLSSLIALLLGWPPLAAAGAVPLNAGTGFQVLHYERLGHLARHEIEANTPARTAASAAYGPLQLSFDAFGRRFDLRLEPNQRLIDAFGTETGARVYFGELGGHPESWVRITEIGDRVHGLIWDGQELFAIEPAAEVVAAAERSASFAPNEPVIFRLTDTLVEPGSMSCGVGDPTAVMSGMTAYRMLAAELEAAAMLVAAQGLDIGVVADHFFFNRFGSVTATEVAIIARMNNVDGIYSSQVGIEITIAETEIFQNSGEDPLSTTTAAGDLLDDFGLYKLNTPALNPLGLAHLYTGRDLDGTTVGVAYLAAVCSSRFGAGLTEGGTRTAFIESLITAHEIGHNFGAPHDMEAGSACETTPDGFLMSPSVCPTCDTFSQCSLDEMAPVIAGATCLTPITGADAMIAAPSTTVVADVGASFALTFAVSSVGADPVDNVMATITIPAGIAVLDAVVAGGACIIGAGQVDCSLGTLPAGTQRNIDLTLQGSQIGDFSLPAQISASNDNNPSNDADSASIRIEAVVDLSATGQGPGASVVQNGSTTFTMSVANLAAFASSDANLAVSLPSGLRATQATPTQGSCTVQTDNVNCALGLLAGGSSASVTVTVDAVLPGSQSLFIIASSTETDSDSGNNTAQVVITVTPQSGGGGTGGSSEDGGGATGLLSLGWLLAHWLYRRRRITRA